MQCLHELNLMIDLNSLFVIRCHALRPEHVYLFHCWNQYAVDADTARILKLLVLLLNNNVIQ